MIRLHGTAVCVQGAAVLLLGPPGSGKSDLALRLIDRGAILVADDQVDMDAAGDALLASPPDSIAGRMEIRGIGLVSLPFLRACPLVLLGDLAALPQRMPLPASREILGISLPVLAFSAFEASAPMKVERAVALATRAALWGEDADC